MDDRLPIKRLIEIQDELVQSKNPFVRHFGSLLAAGALDGHLSELRDEQIAQLMRDVIERDLRIASPEAVICNQASKRLLRSEAGNLEEEHDPPLKCPKCGGEMLLHIGIDEPDFVQCIAVRCNYREYVRTGVAE